MIGGKLKLTNYLYSVTGNVFVVIMFGLFKKNNNAQNFKKQQKGKLQDVNGGGNSAIERPIPKDINEINEKFDKLLVRKNKIKLKKNRDIKEL